MAQFYLLILVRSFRRPVLSGLFVFFSLLCGACRGQDEAPLARLLDGVDIHTREGDPLFSLKPGDTGAFRRCSIVSSYDDLCHVTETGTGGRLVGATIAELMHIAGMAEIKMPHFAFMPWWNLQKGYGCTYDTSEYRHVAASMLSDKAGISGWWGGTNFVAALKLAWNFRGTSDRQGFQTSDFLANGDAVSALDLPQTDWSLQLGYAVKEWFFTAWYEKILLGDFSVSEANIRNGVNDILFLSPMKREIGLRAAVKNSRIVAQASVATGDLLTDTAAAAASALPLAITSRFVQGRLGISLPIFKCQPSLDLQALTGHPRLDAFDQPGTNNGSFFSADSNRFTCLAGQLSGVLPGRVTAGLSAEYCRFGNEQSGLFDPFPFSDFSFFEYSKYRIDTLELRYLSWGLFVKRQQYLRPWWSLDASLAASRVLIGASSSTRVVDFTYIIPRLIDPAHQDWLNGDYLLCRATFSNTFHFRRFDLNGTLQQFVPFNLQHAAASNTSTPSEPGTPLRRTTRGGTRIAVGLTAPI